MRGKYKMRREWLMVLLIVALLGLVGCDCKTTASAAGTSGATASAAGTSGATAGAAGTSGTTDTSGTYTVQRGDCLMSIARELLGDPHRWREIAELNGIKAPYLIYPGRKLVLPKKGETVQTSTQPQASGATAGAAGTSGATTTSRTYKVRSGDCLMGIARELLGDPHRWREIANLNGIGPPYTIYPGWEIKVPEK